MKRLVPVFLVLLLVSPARSDDWPQWMGPKRDNVWREEGILDKFPEKGPKIKWRVPIAGGYAGPAVADGKVFVTDYVTKADVNVDNFDRQTFSGLERVFCLSEADGKEIWKHEYPVKYTVSYPAGPRCTPTVSDGKVYFLGTEGNLLCVNIASGKIAWQKNLKTEYKTKTPLWGYAAHPLIDGKNLLCLVGGEGSHIVAFNKETGAEVWKSQTSEEIGYSPPTIIEAAGKRQLILAQPNAVTSVNPEDGKVYWTVPYNADNGSIIMSPIKSDNFLFIGGYSNKNLLLKLASDKPSAEEVWRNKKKAALSPVNVQPFVEKGTLYGFDQDGKLYAVEVATGKRLWETTNITGSKVAGSETGFIVKQADRFWLFNELGELIIAKLSPEKYEELDRAKVIKQTGKAFGRDVVWCMPAFANKSAYIRNDKECICVDLAK